MCLSSLSLQAALFVPAVQWDVPFFLEPAGGSLVFVAASSVLAVVFCGAHWSAGVSAGVCGPLWLVSEDAKSHEGHVGSSRGLYFMMVSRSLLLAGIVVLKWKVVNSVDAFSVRAVFAVDLQPNSWHHGGNILVDMLGCHMRSALHLRPSSSLCCKGEPWGTLRRGNSLWSADCRRLLAGHTYGTFWSNCVNLPRQGTWINRWSDWSASEKPLWAP